MRRRRVIQSLLSAPALTVLPGCADGQQADSAKLATSVPGAVGDPRPAYFSASQYAALQKLGELLVPVAAARPSAGQAHDAEFLDFLLSQSPPERQALYRNGLDQLQSESRARYGKPF